MVLNIFIQLKVISAICAFVYGVGVYVYFQGYSYVFDIFILLLHVTTYIYESVHTHTYIYKYRYLHARTNIHTSVMLTVVIEFRRNEGIDHNYDDKLESSYVYKQRLSLLL